MSAEAKNGKSETVEITLCVDRKLVESVQPFIEDRLFFSGYDDLFERVLEAIGGRRGDRCVPINFLTLLEVAAQQRGVSFVENLFGRPGNVQDWRALFGLLLGRERLDFINAYEWDELEEKGVDRFARDGATRLAKDLNRDHATEMIELMTMGSAELRAEMLHWLDVALAEEGKA